MVKPVLHVFCTYTVCAWHFCRAHTVYVAYLQQNITCTHTRRRVRTQTRAQYIYRLWVCSHFHLPWYLPLTMVFMVSVDEECLCHTPSPSSLCFQGSLREHAPGHWELTWIQNHQQRLIGTEQKGLLRQYILYETSLNYWSSLFPL